jgi:hypothetical protein
MMSWQPTIVRRFIKALPSSARTAIVETNLGPAYLKAIGGPEGEHTLASELVATRLAQWFGLSTLDFALITIDEVPEITFVDNDGNNYGKAIPGPAFVTRAESGDAWSGDEKQLRRLVNPEDVGRLVVFDTWTLNCDRYSWPTGDVPRPPRVNRNNVFLSEEALKGQFMLKAIDHTHCFTCGREWTRALPQIDNIKDPRLFGMFPEFRTFLGNNRTSVRLAAEQLRRIEQADVARMASDIPAEWHVSREVRDALVLLIVARAAHVSDTIQDKIWPQQSLPLDDQTAMEPEL